MQAALLLQMLASRQRGAGNTQITELLARMNGAAAPDGQSTQDMLSQLAGTNPMLAALMQQMNAGSAGSGGQRALVDIEGEAVEVEASAQPATPDFNDAELCELRARTERLTEELNLMRERVDRCAAALGACGACWGADPACRACRGHGRPGFSKPDESLFDELVLPAMRTLRSFQARPAPRSARPQLHATRQAIVARPATDRGTGYHST